MGAHAPKFNDKSIGICVIGNWTSEYFSFIQFFVVVFLTKDIFVIAELPPPVMIEATHKLIAYSVTSGHLHRNYTLLGHRQVRTTECTFCNQK